MFTSIEIKNFQSIRNLKLELKPFTVIVGATDSGKSAFFRAISTLISNKRGADFITHGEKLCSITGEFTQGKLTLQRGKATSDNFYEVTDLSGVPEKYTKLSGTTPEEVSAFLGIESKDPINLASQFDKPYLLDTKEYGPSETARILGALTNVNVLFEGARESNRQKTQASTELKMRQADLTNVQTKLTGYEDVEATTSKLSVVESILAKMETYEAKLSELNGLIDSMHFAEQKLASITDSTSEVEVDFERAEQISSMHKEVTNLIKMYEAKTQELEQKHAEESMYKEQASELEKKYTETLRKAGTCPICNQSTKNCTD